MSAAEVGRLARVRNLQFGRPLPGSEAVHQRLLRPNAPGAFGLDAPVLIQRGFFIVGRRSWDRRHPCRPPRAG